MSVWPALRPLFLLFAVMAAIFLNRECAVQPIDLPDPPRIFMKSDKDCMVGAEEAKIHNGTKSYEDALVQYVNADNTIQIQTYVTRLAMRFRIEPSYVRCFREGWNVPVTIKECVRDSENKCNFNKPHSVFVRTRDVEVINWKYYKPAL